jgi:ketopantoate hydroxymethyltransferase
MDRTASSKSVFVASVAALIVLSMPFAASASDDEHRKEDMAKHRQIAKAHESAARCLQSGGKPADCHSQLQKACKGIAVGDHCGLRTRAG